MRSRSDAGKRKKDPSVVRVPHDPVNEMVLIAAVVTSAAAWKKYLPSIPSDYFHGKGHATIWEGLREIQARGLNYDPATLRQVSGGQANVELVEEYIEARPEAPPNLRYHVECIFWDNARIQVVRGPLQSFHDAIKDPTAEPERVMSLAQQIARAFEGHGSTRYLRSPEHVVHEQSVHLTERRLGRATYPYGIPGLDYYADGDTNAAGEDVSGEPRFIPGSAPGKITLVTGVTGSGKTTVTCRKCLGMAEEHGRRVLLGAWEQGEGPTLEIIAAMSLGWSRTDLGTGKYTEEDQKELEEEMLRLQEGTKTGGWIRFFKLPFGRARGERNANDQNLDIIHSAVGESGCDVFAADLLRRSFKETDPDDEEQALYRMQAMAEELKVHMIWLHQQRFKDLETRKDKRPTRETVKGSGAWVEVPDTSIGYNRPALWKNVADDVLEALVMKQRFGPWPILVELEYDAEYAHVGDGKVIDYQRPGEESEVDGWLDESLTNKRRRRGKSD